MSKCERLVQPPFFLPRSGQERAAKEDEESQTERREEIGSLQLTDDLFGMEVKEQVADAHDEERDDRPNKEEDTSGPQERPRKSTHVQPHPHTPCTGPIPATGIIGVLREGLSYRRRAAAVLMS